MKKTFLLKILQVGFVCMLFCTVWTTQAGAQATSDHVAEASIGPSGPFVLPAEAVVLLESEMADLRVIMESNPHSSMEYKLALWKYLYYENIIVELEQAETSQDVGLAIIRGLAIYYQDSFYVNGEIPKEEIENNKTAAINLLKQ